MRPAAARARWRRASRLAAAAVAAVLACDPPARALTPPQVESRPKRISFSIAEDYDPGDPPADFRKDFALFRELGVTTWRGSFSWMLLEPSRGTIDLAWLEQFARAAAQGGITLRPYIAYTPAWASAGGRDSDVWNDPPHLDRWYGFVRALAAAMNRHPNVVSFEIYNEENVPQWWDGSAGAYGDVLRRAAQAIHDARSRASLLLGGLVYPDAGWIRQVCGDSRDGPMIAAIPFHAYPETWEKETVEDYLGPNFEGGFVHTVDASCGPKPIWMNEIGFATLPGRSEHDQAEWWARAIATFAAEPRVEQIGIYEIKDLRQAREAIGGAPNYHLGITTANRVKKLAFYTLQRLVSLLTAAPFTATTPEVRVTSGNRAAHVFRHAFERDDGEQILFVWTKDAPVTVDVDLPHPASHATEYGIDGRPKPYSSLDSRTLSAVALVANEVRIFDLKP